MMGYCPHVSSLFGSWHRPYLALFEQILHDRAVDIANEYPSGEAREKAMETANKVRLPYWDWAANPTAGDGVVPSSVRQRTVTVTHPNGTRSEIANPLYRYEFHPLKYDDFAPLVCPLITCLPVPEANNGTEPIRIQRLEPYHSLPT
jgi:tyrosinase